MRTKNTFIPIFLSIALLFQSCVAYHKQPINLQQAVEKNTKVRVKSKDGKVITYKYIASRDGDFFGVKSKKKQSQVFKDEIISIRAKHIRGTTVNAVIGAIIITGLFFSLSDFYFWDQL